MVNRSLFRVTLAAALLCALPWQAGSAGPEPQAGGATVTIPFRALSGEGQPVTDLKAADVSLKVDGRVREIKSFELVEVKAAPPAAAVPAKADVPAPFVTNAAGTGKAARDVYVLVDEESIAPGKDGAVKDAIGHLVSSLSTQDRVALISIRQGGVNQGLTSDFAAVKTKAGSIAGFGSARQESGNDVTCRTVRAIQTLQSVFAGAAASTGPPTVVFFSSAVAALQSGRTANVGGVTGSELCEIRNEHMNQLGSAAFTSRSNFFVVELTDSGPGTRPNEASGGLENLAGVTNGENIRMSSNAEAQMKRIAVSTSAYYLVGFDSEASDRSGNKRVELTVARGGVNVRAPREMAFGKTAGKSAATPKDMIRTSSSFTDLSLRAAAYSSRNPGDDKIKVLTLFEPTESTTKLNAASVGFFDAKGKLIAQWTAQPVELAGPIGMAALVVPAGVYRVRVAATDGAGRSGAVDINDFAATLIEAGPIKLGDLVLGKIGETGARPALQFASEQEAIAIVELYGRPTGPLKMYVEILGPAEPIQVALAPAQTGEQDKFLLTAKLPINDLKPGDYKVRAVVGVEGQPDGQLARTLRKIGSGS
jgi:hypothetical protein